MVSSTSMVGKKSLGRRHGQATRRDGDAFWGLEPDGIFCPGGNFADTLGWLPLALALKCSGDSDGVG